MTITRLCWKFPAVWDIFGARNVSGAGSILAIHITDFRMKYKRVVTFVSSSPGDCSRAKSGIVNRHVGLSTTPQAIYKIQHYADLNSYCSLVHNIWINRFILYVTRQRRKFSHQTVVLPCTPVPPNMFILVTYSNRSYCKLRVLSQLICDWWVAVELDDRSASWQWGTHRGANQDKCIAVSGFVGMWKWISLHHKYSIKISASPFIENRMKFKPVSTTCSCCFLI